jgi:hypothetical protein
MVSIGSIKHEGMAALCQEGPKLIEYSKRKRNGFEKNERHLKLQ